jgi:hypothetical protein
MSPPAREDKLKPKKSIKLNEDIHLITGAKFAENTTTTQEDVTGNDPTQEPSVISRNHHGRRNKTDTPPQVTLKSSFSRKGPLALRESAKYVRSVNLKRAALISASHNGTG